MEDDVDPYRYAVVATRSACLTHIDIVRTDMRPARPRVTDAR